MGTKKNIILTIRCHIYIMIAGIIGMSIIWYNMKYMGNIAYWISIASGILIISSSLLILNNE
jgi:hypothetical protein